LARPGRFAQALNQSGDCLKHRIRVMANAHMWAQGRVMATVASGNHLICQYMQIVPAAQTGGARAGGC
jgi:hypothetical protein